MRSRIIALCAITTLLGCEMSFAPATLLDDVRVLALIPNPIEVDLRDLSQNVEIRAEIFVPEGRTVTSRRWTFCPISAGSRTGFACAIPECIIELDEREENVVEANVAGLALECLARLEGSATSTSAIPGGELPEVVETQFRYNVETDDGASREAIARVLVYTERLPEPINRHPRFEKIFIGTETATVGIRLSPLPVGEARPIQVRIDESSLDDYVDSAGETRTELPLVSYYSTAGRFDATRTDDVVAANNFKAEELAETDEDASLYIVVRDGRGGQSVAGPFLMPIRR